MDNITITGMKVLPTQDQLRLVEVSEIYKAISYTKTGNLLVDTSIEIMLGGFFKYISNYANIISVKTVEELLEKFSKSTGVGEWINVKVIKNIYFKNTDNIVNLKIYEFVYFKLWPSYLQALKKSINANKKNFNFRYHISKEDILTFYEKESNALSRFKEDVFEMLEVNGFKDCIGIDEECKYIIQIN